MNVRNQRWREVEAVFGYTKASSTPRPKGFPCKVYKSASDVSGFLWSRLKIGVGETSSAKSLVWEQLIPKEKYLLKGMVHVIF